MLLLVVSLVILFIVVVFEELGQIFAFFFLRGENSVCVCVCVCVRVW